MDIIIIGCLIALLWETGCLPTLIAGFILLGCLVFLKKHFLIIALTCLLVFFVLVAIAYIIDYLKYKDETGEERAEILKLEEMLDKWRKQFK